MYEGFVKVNGLSFADLGLAKVVDVDEDVVTVCWFDSPVTDVFTNSVPKENIQAVTLDRQTRVYWLDKVSNVWRVGRIIDADEIRAQVRFANSADDLILPVSDLEVRWDRAINEPSLFLLSHINESPIFADARTCFKRCLVRQRAASSGMSALLSSVISLEQHQYEVVKRVLQDPFQRYLLADEVGLGKTIEAGVLIRQFVLDEPKEHSILVLAPKTLVMQWRRELRKRFLLGDFLDDTLNVMSLDDDPSELLGAIVSSKMLVIDEAHHLSQDATLYTTLRESIISVPRLLLLSATPVLHNERGFLEMLHLLDPHVYRLQDEKTFRERIEHRQFLAECVAGLIPENLLSIDEYIDALIEIFPSDNLLQKHAEVLEKVVSNFPEEEDPEFQEALRVLRTHLTETYRLDRRILRNRRRDFPYLTPPRSGLVRVEYSSVQEERLNQAIENWRSTASAKLYGHESEDITKSYANFFLELIEATFSDLIKVSFIAKKRILDSNINISDDSETKAINEIINAAEACLNDSQKSDALISLVKEELGNKNKIVIFCSETHTGDEIFTVLTKQLSEPVERHVPQEDFEDDELNQVWEDFLTNPEHRILVCDKQAEEGLNLQGGGKIIIHYDLPLAPNRIEQRLGRVDRYGSGDAIKSFALCCVDDPYSNVWLNYIDNGLKLFDRSVASLQYVIDEEMYALKEDLFWKGIDALETLSERTSGEDGVADRELRRIDQQDALDALTIDDESEDFETLSDVDSEWREISQATQGWLVNILNTEIEHQRPNQSMDFGFGKFRFCFSYDGRSSESLIPLKRIFSALLSVIDTSAPGANSKLIKTDWYSSRRATAISESGNERLTRLIRWGDELVDSLEALTDLDDRGRVSAMWRQNRGYRLEDDTSVELYLRFDFIVDADIFSALKQSRNLSIGELNRALSRRADMVLPPFYKTIWIDQSMSIVKDEALLNVLEAPYSKAINGGEYKDWNLNQDRWEYLLEKDLPVINDWKEWIPVAREKAELLLRQETDLEKICEQALQRAHIVDQIRFSQLEARLQYSGYFDTENLQDLLQREKEISQAIYSSVISPKITLGTLSAMFLSPNSIEG